MNVEASSGAQSLVKGFARQAWGDLCYSQYDELFNWRKKYRGYFWLRMHFNVLLIKTKGFLRFTLESNILCRVNTQNKFY